MTEELRQQLTVLYMLRGSEEILQSTMLHSTMLQSDMLQSIDVQAPVPLPTQSPRTSGTMPGGEAEYPAPQLSSVIVFKTALGAQAVAIEDIICCVAAGKNALLHCAGEEKPIPVFHSLSDIAKRLEAYPQFVCCHRSTLLNVAHCKAWRHALKEAIALVNLGGERVEEFIVSRTRKETFLQRWEEYFCKKRPQK